MSLGRASNQNKVFEPQHPPTRLLQNTQQMESRIHSENQAANLRGNKDQAKPPISRGREESALGEGALGSWMVRVPLGSPWESCSEQGRGFQSKALVTYNEDDDRQLR